MSRSGEEVFSIYVKNMMCINHHTNSLMRSCVIRAVDPLSSPSFQVSVSLVRSSLRVFADHKPKGDLVRERIESTVEEPTKCINLPDDGTYARMCRGKVVRGGVWGGVEVL